MRRIICLATVLLLLSACNFFVSQHQTQASDILGSDGLTITVGTLPQQVYVGQGLEIPIMLENVGAHNVANGILSLSGYDSGIVHFGTFPKVEGINLGGRSTFQPVGERTTQIFTINSFTLPDLNEKKVSFEALACYQYSTDASPVVCINPQLVLGTQPTTQQACNFLDAQLSTTQGAPVAVTKVEEFYDIEHSQVEFRIFMKDVSGKGVVLDKQAYAKRCLSPDPLSLEDINKVAIEAFMSGERISCYDFASDTPVDTFKINNQGPSVRCRARFDPTKAAFTTPLSIMLSYGYVTDRVFSLTVKNPSKI